MRRKDNTKLFFDFLSARPTINKKEICGKFVRNSLGSIHACINLLHSVINGKQNERISTINPASSHQTRALIIN